MAFWVAMIVNSSFGFNQGNPLRLTYGLDYKGNVCGDKHAKGLRQLELKYWLNPNQVYLSGLKDNQFKLANARSICLLDCPIPSEDSLSWVCDYPEGDIRLSMDDWIDRNYDYYEFLTPEMRNTSLQLQGPCYPVIFPSVNVYWSCQFIARPSNVSLRHWQQMGGVNINEDIIIDKSIHRSINSRSSVLKRYMADIGKAWPVLIVCGGILPLFLSVIWLLLIRHFVAAMPWITVGLFNILIIAVTMFYYLKAGWIGNDAISPIIGEHDPYIRISGRELTHLRAAAVFMTFITVVAVLTSIAIVRRILMATSPEIPFLPVFSSMKRLVRYNLGSVALGSLIVSFVESIRFMLESIRRRLKVAGTTPGNWFGKAVYHTSRFSLRCIEWTIKSANRNAYIMIAITGKSFCKASAIATDLIFSNILRIGRVCWGLGYVVATLFFAVVEMSIDTIILSFCQDSEEHQGTAQYAPPLLIETLNDQNEMQRLTQGPQ
ncbi:Plasma-membrane choline transporter family protein [Prunus dulcis]|uniref:Choline transporter-like protein n=1 Tax=Prunus dulcis TaxID=3755 RepID=A0A4Y1RCN9_PRUDU|nr:Plasma-membrane choline transporter family protein [Prunus dulcis]